MKGALLTSLRGLLQFEQSASHTDLTVPEDDKDWFW